MDKIGILGGTFDPIHIAHIIGAQKVKEDFGLNKTIFIPTYIPPYKELPKASPEDRLNMTRLAVRDNPDFEVLDIEIKRKGVSYTIDTIRELNSIYTNSKLYLIMGKDEAQFFMSWKEPEKLASLCSFILLTRKGYKGKLPKILEQKALFYQLDIDVSSTKIRQMIKESRPVDHLLTKEVENYIKEKHLYCKRREEEAERRVK